MFRGLSVECDAEYLQGAAEQLLEQLRSGQAWSLLPTVRTPVPNTPWLLEFPWEEIEWAHPRADLIYDPDGEFAKHYESQAVGRGYYLRFDMDLTDEERKALVRLAQAYLDGDVRWAAVGVQLIGQSGVLLAEIRAAEYDAEGGQEVALAVHSAMELEELAEALYQGLVVHLSRIVDRLIEEFRPLILERSSV